MASSAEMRAKLILEIQDLLSQELKKTEKSATDSAKKTQKTWLTSLKSMQAQMKATSATMAAGANRMKSGFVQMATAIAPLAPFAVMAKQAANFDRGMREVSTLVNQTPAVFRKNFDKIIEETQLTFGGNSQEVIKSFYDGISAGVPATQKAVSEFLTATGRLKVGGVTDFKTAGDVLTSAVNAYGKENLNFSKAANIVFATVKEGKTTVTELGAALGQITPVAATLGIKFEEVGAGLAALTSTGLSTSESVTQLKSLMTSFLSPSKQAEDQLNNMGLTSLKLLKIIKGKAGLQGALNLVSQRIKATTKDSAQQAKIYGQVFNNVRALQAAFTLTGSQQNKFNSALKTTSSNLDFSREAFEKMSGPALEYDKAMQSISIASRKIGEQVLPIFAEWLTKFNKGLPNLLKWIEGNREFIKVIFKTAAALSALKFAFGFFNTIFGTFAIIKALTGGTFKLTGAIKLLGTVAKSSFAIWSIIIAGFASWTYVITQLSDKTTALGGDIRVLFSDLESAALVFQKIKNFVKYLFTGKIGAEDLAIQQKIDERRRSLNIDTQAVQKNAVQSGVNKTNNVNAGTTINTTVNVQGGAGDPAKIGQEIGKKQIEEIERQQRKRKQKLAMVGL